MSAFAVAGACLVAALVALAAWRRARREAARLRDRLEASRIELQSLQLAFGRFAPDEVIERLIAEGGIDERGEKKEVTVLFADLAGFTALSESVEPPVLVRILNGYFQRMSDAIVEHRGTVSSFIGDGILAYFGALAPNPWQGNDAMHAALAMQEALADYNRELEAESLPPLEMGIGLQRGEGVTGLVGSHDLKEFAFVGRVVNVAARVQDLTRQFEPDIIVTDRVAEGADPAFEFVPLPPTQVKGVDEAVAICGLVGHRGASG